MRHGLVLVSGAGGFVGGHVVRGLRAAGYEVRATDLPGSDSTMALEAGAQWIEADLLSRGAAAQLVDGVRGVVNAAGLFDFGMDWDRLYDANVLLTEQLCAAAAEARVDKFVHISSAVAYGTPEKTPAAEATTHEPKNDYEKTKSLSEEKVWFYQRFKGLHATILRPASIYGPRSRYVLGTVMALYALGRHKGYDWLRIPSGGALCHHVHVEDVAEACRLLLRRSEVVGNAYNVADTTPVRWGELLRYIAELVDFESQASLPIFGPLGKALAVAGEWLPSSQLIRINRVLGQDWEELTREMEMDSPLVPRLDRDMFGYFAGDHVYDVSALHRLGFRPSHAVTLNGLRDTFDWYMSQGWLPGARDLTQN